MWGVVWSLGAKEYAGGDGTTYLQFVLRLPRVPDMLERAPVRVWVRWYGGDFWPQPHDRLKVSGKLYGQMVQERLDKSPKINLILEALEVQKLEKAPKRA